MWVDDDAMRSWVPSSRSPLPEADFQQRHRGLLWLLAFQLIALPLFGVTQGWSIWSSVLVCVPAAFFGICAIPSRLGRTGQASCCVLALLSCSAALVWLWHGQTEAHFHYFVMVGAVALYEAAWPYAIAFVFVFFQHGLMSVWMPGRVYGSMVAMQHPWLYACIHGGFIGALALANLVYWRASSRTRDREQIAVADLAYHATHDPLTGLLNRRAFTEHAQALLDARQQSTVAALFVDVDDFKIVNDSLGHDAGDELLIAVTQRLSSVIRQGDLLGRFGGDEFVLCLEESSADGVSETARRLSLAVAAPFILVGVERLVTVSIGLAIAEPDERSVDSWLRDADLAMYEAKAAGKAQHHWFDMSMRRKAIDRLELESDLRDAVAHGQIEAHFQPQVRVSDGRVIGFEALARWNHPDRGMIPPDVFIPIAEHSGLVGAIGAHMLTVACQHAQMWARDDPTMGALGISINASPRCIGNEDLPGVVEDILSQTGVEASRVCIEITETAVVGRSTRAQGVIHGLKALGVRLAIDDFGVGQSSLSQLARLGPIDELKIDKAFIDDISTSNTASRVVGAIISVATSDGLNVVAEGVEDAAQRDQLSELGCPTIQGFLYSRPLPAAQFYRYATQQNRHSLAQDTAIDASMISRDDSTSVVT